MEALTTGTDPTQINPFAPSTSMAEPEPSAEMPIHFPSTFSSEESEPIQGTVVLLTSCLRKISLPSAKKKKVSFNLKFNTVEEFAKDPEKQKLTLPPAMQKTDTFPDPDALFNPLPLRKVHHVVAVTDQLLLYDLNYKSIFIILMIGMIIIGVKSVDFSDYTAS